MNNLGGMVFIVFGIALGYWVMTGKAANFLQAINGTTPAQPGQNPLSGLTPQPNPGQSTITPLPFNILSYPSTGPSNSNVSQNVPSNWISI